MSSAAGAPNTDDVEHRLDRIFHALANRTRRAMLRRLAEGPATVSELAAPFDMSLPSSSKNIRVLEEAGLVERAIDGRVHRCALRPDTLRDAEEWLGYYRGFWSDALDAVARYVEGATDDEDEDAKPSSEPRGTPRAGER